MIEPDIKQCQAIVLSSDRESAHGIKDVITDIGKFMDVKCHFSGGGTSIRLESEALQENIPHVLVGVSGRISHIIDRRFIKVDDIKLVILDSADQILSVCIRDPLYWLSHSFPCFALLMNIIS